MKTTESDNQTQPPSRLREPYPSQYNGGSLSKLSTSIAESPANKDIILLTVSGDMDTNTAPEFEKSFLTVLQDKKYKIVVDLKEVHYISSAGWGIFVSELKRIRNENGDLVLAGMNPDVLDVFQLLQFDSILKYFPTVETAVSKGFKANPDAKKQPAR